MAHTVKVLEQSKVSPPSGSVPSTSIPLTFFDLPWFYCPPLKRIFLYEFPYSTQHFLQTVLPTLKHSLSLTLQHFFPFAANVVFPPKPHKPHILYSDGDYINFTVAESAAGFTHLLSESPRDVRDFHPFVPTLPSPRTLEDGTIFIPLMAIQVTVLPNYAFSICFTFRHVVADGRAFHHFLKTWASICKSKGDWASLQASLTLPLYNRDIVEDPIGLKQIFLEELWNSSLKNIDSNGIMHDVPSDMVRHKFVLSHDHVEKLKKWVTIKCKSHGSGNFHITTFVVTCSLIWVCKVKSGETTVDTLLPGNDESYILAFRADCRNRPEFSIPAEYFGNCLVSGNAEVKRSKLVGENGIFEAAIAIGNEVLQCRTFEGAKALMSDFTDSAKFGQHMTIVVGSPNLKVYETDFGWGKPKKSEVVHMDSSELINLSDCRDKEGKIEIGLALEKNQMKKFITILEEHLAEIASLE